MGFSSSGEKRGWGRGPPPVHIIRARVNKERKAERAVGGHYYGAWSPPRPPAAVLMGRVRHAHSESFQEPKGADAVTRYLHETLPVTVQWTLRDRVLGAVADYGAGLMGLMFAFSKPWIIREFLGLARHMEVRTYGPHPGQFVEIYRCGKPNAPALVFVHGGAWYSGRPWMYRLIANAVLRQGFDLFIPAYSIYSPLEERPGGRIGDADHQIDDLEHCLHSLGLEEGLMDGRRPRHLVLMGHSSGAHIIYLMMLRRTLLTNRRGASIPPISAVVGLSGIYDIEEHWQWESRRGVHEVSGMQPANGGVHAFHRYSPTVLAEQLSAAQAKAMPICVLVHGTMDDTVPFTNSLNFAHVLESRGVRSSSCWIEGCDHFGPVGHLMFEKESRTELHLQDLRMELLEIPPTPPPPDYDDEGPVRPRSRL